MKSLFMAWQAPDRGWYPVGRLDADVSRSSYEFGYTQGAYMAHEHAGFQPFIAFPDFEKRYQSSDLFPLFKNRVLDPSRKDFRDYLEWLALDPSHTDPIEILGVTGGERFTDSLEVFPLMKAAADGRFSCRFFLHGLRYMPDSAKDRVSELKEQEQLQVALEVNNPATTYAIQIQANKHILGYAPRFLVKDLHTALSQHAHIEAKAVKLNGMNSPLSRRVLIEINGTLAQGVSPMSQTEFLPYTGQTADPVM